MPSPNRRDFLRTLAAGLGALPAASLACRSAGDLARGRRPNVLLLIADQLRAASVGCLGNPDVRTPHLDRLAAGGALLRQAFALSPVCSPCRAQIFTGKYGGKTGHRPNFPTSPLFYKLPLEERSLAELLAAEGYATGFIGKWHMAPKDREPDDDEDDAEDGEDERFIPPGPERQGFDFWILSCRLNGHYDVPYLFGDSPEPRVVPGFGCDHETEWALDYLRGFRRDTSEPARPPFFLTVSWNPPHDPYWPPAAFDTYPPEELSLRPNVEPRFAAEAREDLAGYYGLISAVDANVGRLLDALETWDLARDTVVIFTSDHGDLLHSHRHRVRTYHHKRSPWDEAARVPLMVRYPRAVAAGQIHDALTGSVDLVPTVLGLLGLPQPADLQGEDLAPLLRGEPWQGRESLFLHMTATGHLPHRAPWRAVRAGRWWYAVSGGVPGQDWLLYDTLEDPYEEHNRIADPAAASVREELAARLAAWRRRLGDDLDLSRYLRG